jgi:hypothetical protein
MGRSRRNSLKEKSMKLYDYFLVLGLVGSISYIFLFEWMNCNQYESFSMIGAAFLIIFITLMLKFFIVVGIIGLEWLLPKMNKKFKKINIKLPTINLINKRIEIRIIDKHNKNGRVTF